MLQHLSTGHWVWQVDDTCGTITPELIKALCEWRQTGFFSREAGGVILGFIDSDTGGLLAERITRPGLGDQRSRYGFYRGPRHQLEAEQWHRKTAQRGTQLGIWHTHPESHPTPSHTDLEDLRTVLRKGTYHGTGLMILIVGTEFIGCWLGRPSGQITELGWIEL